MVSLLAGALDADDRTRIATLDPDVLVQRVDDVLDVFRRQRDEVNNLLVGGETDIRGERFRSIAIDRGQEVGVDELAYEGHGANEWSVTYAWKRIQWRFSYNRERWYYIDLAALSEEIEGKLVGNAARHLLEMGRAAWDNRTFRDRDEYGDLVVRPFANGDGHIFTDRFGAQGPENFYRVAGYAASAISITNNPFEACVELYDRYYGAGIDVALVAREDAKFYVQGLADNLVTETRDGITRGSGESQAQRLGGVTIPGDFVGIDESTGTYIYKWDQIPAGYFEFKRIGTPPALMRRVPDVPELVGFRLEMDEERFPFLSRLFTERFGYNVKNRLGLIHTQLKASGDYDVPLRFRVNRDVIDPE